MGTTLEGDGSCRPIANDDRERRAGFTLVELMITVAIVGILSAVSLPLLHTYIARSRTVEATGFLAEIKARQESYRFDFGEYCNVSGTQGTYYPTDDPGPNTQVWVPGAADAANWNVLGAMPPGRQSLFVYSSVAGRPGTLPGPQMEDGGNRGYTNADFWFINTALGDLDGDDINMRYENYSHSKGVWSSLTEGTE